MKFRLSSRSGVCLLLLLFFCLWITAPAVAAELDRSFGDQGRITTAVGHVGDQAHAVVMQPDGKIVVGGSASNSADLDFAVIRYNPDGTLDSSFNSDGMVTTAVGRGDDEIAALAVQDDGRILAAGYSVNGTARDFALVRYNVDGSLDTDFGQEGMVVTPVGNSDDEITSMAVDQQGRIVVAGYTTGTLGRAVAVGRYLADGSPDVSFGDQGITLTGVGKDVMARSMVLDPEGRILVAGSYTDDAGQAGVVLLRYLDSGVLDTTFGQAGVAVSADERPCEGFGVRLQDDGAILVAGSVGDAGSRDTALFRFTADGRPDLSFAENGVLVSSVSPGDDMALAVAVRNDTISVSGFSTTTDGARDFLFMTYANGLVASADSTATTTAPDPAAGSSVMIGELRVEDSAAGYQAEMTSGDPSSDRGIVTTTSFGSADDVGDALALQPDGKAVVAGFAGDGGTTSFAVARYTAVEAANINSPGFTATWIVTKGLNNVTRTGAITGGIIEADSGLTITQRGVVFSIAPDPVLKSGNTGGGDVAAPVISNTTPADFAAGAAVTLSVDTDENATCKYTTAAGTPYDSMNYTFETTGTTQHEQNLGVLSAGTYTYQVRCQDAAGNVNTSDFPVSFTVGAGTAAVHFHRPDFSGHVGGLFAATAYAADTTTAMTATATTAQQGFSSTTDNFVDEGSTNDGSGPGSFSSIIKNLKPGTSYFVRAYAMTSDGRIYYGNQNVFRTADACFIATAAYGTIIHPYVRLLRNFRDRYLLTNQAGRAFVRLYYHYSPPLADYIAGRPVLRLVVRILLLPFIGMSWLALNFDFSGLLLLTALGVVPCLLLRRAWGRRSSLNP